MFVERKHWTPKEDQSLLELVQSIGTTNWTLISLRLSQKCPDSLRTGKQCRQRWSNYLKKKVDNVPWNCEEEERLFDLHKIHGNKWKQIAKSFPNRAQCQLKNHVFAALRKGIRRMNKFTGMKFDPATIRTIKPAIMTEVCMEDQKYHALFTEKTLDKKIQITDLVLKFSSSKLVDKEIETFLENSQMVKNIEQILHTFVNKNTQYQLTKKEKKSSIQERKLRHLIPTQHSPTSQFHSLDVNEFLNFQTQKQAPSYKSADYEFIFLNQSNDSLFSSLGEMSPEN